MGPFTFDEGLRKVTNMEGLLEDKVKAFYALWGRTVSQASVLQQTQVRRGLTRKHLLQFYSDDKNMPFFLFFVPVDFGSGGSKASTDTGKSLEENLLFHHILKVPYWIRFWWLWRPLEYSHCHVQSRLRWFDLGNMRWIHAFMLFMVNSDPTIWMSQLKLRLIRAENVFSICYYLIFVSLCELYPRFPVLS